MLTEITQHARFVSPEEHATLTSSTPESFASIPPIVRYQKQEVRIAFSPDWQSYGEQGQVGSLLVTEAAFSFIPTDTSKSGFSLDYPSITLHAISRDNFGPSVYCQLDESAQPGQSAPPPTRLVEGREDGHYHPEDEEEEDAPMREMRILVDEPSVEPIFLSLSECASLHPSIFDSVDGFSDDEGIYTQPGEGFVPFTGDNGEELSEVGRAALEHLESIIVWPVAEGAAVEDADEDAQPSPKTGDKRVNGHE